MKSLLKKEKCISALIFSLLISGATVVGHSIYKTNNLSETFKDLSSVLRAAAVFLILAFMTFLVTWILYSCLSEKRLEAKGNGFITFLSSTKGFFLVWAAIFVSWVPCYLAYYPGILSYDIIGQNAQVDTGMLTSHHPPLHTYIWMFCAFLEEKTGIARVSFYGIFQMLLLSFAEAKVIKFLSEKKIPTVFIILSLLFFCVNPVSALISVLPIKDVCCAAFFCLLSLSVCRLISDTCEFLHSGKRIAVFCIEALLFCLFRNNAVYALVIAAIVFIIVLRKHFVRITLLFAVPICCFYFITNTVYGMLDIEKGSDVEMLSVPLQQIAFAVSNHGDEIDGELKEEIEKFLPWDFETIKENYNPRFADPIKAMADMNYGFKPIIKSWIKLFLRYPGDFFSAYLSLNLPYWYPLSSPTDEFSGRLFIETKSFYPDTTIQWKRLFPRLLEYYEKVSDYTGAMSSFPCNLLCSISLPVWLILFFAFMSFEKGRRNILFFLLPVLFWLTYMLGPVSSFRYLIPIYVQYPMIVSVGLFSKGETDEKKI